MRYALGVKIEGTIWSLVAVFVLLLAAAVAVGLVLSMLSRSDTQAVQFAMLTLLASMFFGGFFLSLDALRYPFKGVSWILPVTYAIRGLQDVTSFGDRRRTQSTSSRSRRHHGCCRNGGLAAPTPGGSAGVTDPGGPYRRRRRSKRTSRSPCSRNSDCSSSGR
ncbi:MAG: ABC transporter permease [Acidimicrobiales bacterium]